MVTKLFNIYLLATKLRQGNVLHLSVILFTGGGVCHKRPPRHTTPQTHHHSLWTHHPLWTSHPLPLNTPRPLDTPPPLDTSPPTRAVDAGIRSTSGRYASYWNAFLCSHDFDAKKSGRYKQVLVLNELVTNRTHCSGTRTSILLSLDSNKTPHKTFQKHNLFQVFK